jgi:hypothetical protein
MKAYRLPRHPEAFSISPARGRRRPRVNAASHLLWIRTLPCLATGQSAHVEAAHVRFPSARYGKRETGMSEKPDDRWTVPLCADKHRLATDAQHAGNERAFWKRIGIDPLAVALALWGCSGDDELAHNIIREARAAANPQGTSA